MKAALEGLLFIVGDDGISKQQIGEILELNEDEAQNLINDLTEDYSSSERGIFLKKFGDLYKLVTKDDYTSYYKKLTELENVRNLSQAALETLAIIAYNEPITRLQVDELRGVNSVQMIRNLLAKDLIKEVGKSDGLGHCTLYGITNQFLDYFGLASKEDLPKLIIEEQSDEEVDLYESKYEDK